MTRIQDDLFEAVNADWLKKTEIPSDRPRIAAFDELVIENEKRLTADLKDLSAHLPEDAILREAIKFYNKAGDWAARNGDDFSAVKTEMAKISELSSFADFLSHLPELAFHSQAPLPFTFGVEPDMKDAIHYALGFTGPDLILPDTSYYADENPRKSDLLAFWTKNSTEILTAFGVSHAEEIVADALKFDVLLVPAKNTSEENVKYAELYNPVKFNDFTAKVPLAAFINTLIKQAPDKVIVYENRFFDGYADLINPENWTLIKSWMLVKTARKATGYLSEDLRVLGSAFGRHLSNIAEPRSQEKAQLDITESYFSQAIGLFYGKKYFGEAGKLDVTRMVKVMIGIYQKRLAANRWLSKATAEKAIEKLDAITPMIGYPDKLPEVLSKLTVDTGTLYEDAIRFDEILTARHFEKFHEDVDRSEWHMPAHMVNAYYRPDSNVIVFPAAILQAPFYDNKTQTASQNYGGIGAVIAHEISHAFDNNGAQFDKYGNLNKWWTDEDYAAFEGKQAEMIAEFDRVETEAGKANGKLIVSENIADNGGMSAALAATHEEPDANFTEFFNQWGEIWRIKASIEYQQMLLSLDPHAPGKLRANIPPTNFPEFYETFDVQPSDGMFRAPEARLVIW